MIRQAVKDLNRLRQIATVAARYGFADLLERAKLWELLGRREVEQSAETQSGSTARRFCGMLNELGPTFVKLGQILSTRPDMLPASWIEELSQLQDNVPPFGLEEVHAQIVAGLGKPLTELFAEIDEKPLASASIAQVHRARTHGGEQVVVKVQRPEIASRIRADLDLLYYTARLLEALFEEGGIYTPTGIVEEFDRAIHEELDFDREAESLRQFRKNHETRDYVAIPKVHDGLCCRTVLTMELLEGEKISAIDLTKHDRRALAEHILEGAFRQLFTDGLFHGDPHPGNILVLPGDRLGLLDFGMVGRLSKPMQETLVMLVMAVALRDADAVARLLYRIATPDHRANLTAFRADIAGIFDRHLQDTSTLGGIDARTVAGELLDLAVKYRIRIPKEYALLSRAAISTEGLVRWLYPELDVSQVLLPYGKELLFGRYDPSLLSGGLMKGVLRLQELTSVLPMQLSQILLDMESGKSSVNVRSDALDKIHSSLRSLAAITFMGLMASAFTIGAFISFARSPWDLNGVPVQGLIALLLAGMLTGAALAWYWLSGGLRKMRFSRRRGRP